MPFQKGHSINPGGLSPKERSLKLRLQDLSFKAVNTLENILDSQQTTTSEKLTAAKEVLDRFLGKPKIRADVQMTHEAGDHLAALVSMAASTAQKVGHVPQNVPQIEGQVVDITGLVTIEEDKEHSNVELGTQGAHGKKA